MSAKWPSSVATDADLYVAVNSLQTTLSTAIGTSDTSVVLASATGFPAAGGVTIDNEVIFYTGVSGATLTGCTRGADGTTAASHSVGVPVGASIIAFHHNGLMAEIEAIESYLDTVLGKGTSVTATEFGYVHGVTSAIQTQMNLKAPLAGPTFTGTVTIPTPFTLGAVSVTATGTEMNYLVGVSSAIQTQLGLKAPLASPTFTGTATVPNVAITDASNQFVLGVTRTVTITAPTPATSSRTWTIPDITGNGTFAALEGTQTFTGAKTFSGVFIASSATGNRYHGDASNSAVAAGDIGEVIQSSIVFSGRVSSTGSSQAFDVTSIALTAGKWLVSGIIIYDHSSATLTTFGAFLGTTSGNSTTGFDGINGAEAAYAANPAADVSVPITQQSFLLSGNQTVYLKAFMAYTGGPAKAYGGILAHRVG